MLLSPLSRVRGCVQALQELASGVYGSTPERPQGPQHVCPYGLLQDLCEDREDWRLTAVSAKASLLQQGLAAHRSVLGLCLGAELVASTVQCC